MPTTKLLIEVEGEEAEKVVNSIIKGVAESMPELIENDVQVKFVAAFTGDNLNLAEAKAKRKNKGRKRNNDSDPFLKKLRDMYDKD